jgi:4TM region of pyridine nucleotide transhydrogenase, mitoch
MAENALNDAIDKLNEAVEVVKQTAGNLPDAAGVALHGLSGGAIDPFVFQLAIFVLAIFVGYYVVWSVTPALHTPDGCDQCDFVGNCRGRASGGRRLGKRMGDRIWLRRTHPRLGKHIRRLPRHPAHARHVQEKRQVRP